MSYLDEFVCKEIIMDHITNPRNKDKDHNNYLLGHLKNPSCGDEISVYVLLENNIIKDVTYNVVGCSICKSSVSILSELFIDKNIEEAKNIILDFNKMVLGEDYNIEILKDAACFNGVVKTPPRIKCATLGYKAFEDAIKNER